MKIVAFLVLLFVSFFTIPTGDGKPSVATNTEKREQELFLLGAKDIANKRFDQGRILLNTLINTYPESPLKEQAKLLVFYSYASEGGTINEKDAALLQQIEAEMKMRELHSQQQ